MTAAVHRRCLWAEEGGGLRGWRRGNSCSDSPAGTFENLRDASDQEADEPRLPRESDAQRAPAPPSPRSGREEAGDRVVTVVSERSAGEKRIKQRIISVRLASHFATSRSRPAARIPHDDSPPIAMLSRRGTDWSRVSDFTQLPAASQIGRQIRPQVSSLEPALKEQYQNKTMV